MRTSRFAKVVICAIKSYRRGSHPEHGVWMNERQSSAPGRGRDCICRFESTCGARIRSCLPRRRADHADSGSRSEDEGPMNMAPSYGQRSASSSEEKSCKRRCGGRLRLPIRNQHGTGSATIESVGAWVPRISLDGGWARGIQYWLCTAGGGAFKTIQVLPLR